MEKVKSFIFLVKFLLNTMISGRSPVVTELKFSPTDLFAVFYVHSGARRKVPTNPFLTLIFPLWVQNVRTYVRTSVRTSVRPGTYRAQFLTDFGFQTHFRILSQLSRGTFLDFSKFLFLRTIRTKNVLKIGYLAKIDVYSPI